MIHALRLIVLVTGMSATVLGVPTKPVPTPLETAHLLGPGHPAGPTPVELSDDLFLLGMSPGNQAAFLERRNVNAGQFLWRTWIQDLVTDEVLSEQSWDDDGSDLTTWWGAHEPEVTRDFARWRMEDPEYQLGEFPVILDDEFYTASLRTTWTDRLPRHIERLEVVVRSTGRGIKTVHDSLGDWQWATILGFLPSPYENRLALILLVQPRGWAGPNQPLRFLVTGASLKAGFDAP